MSWVCPADVTDVGRERKEDYIINLAKPFNKSSAGYRKKIIAEKNKTDNEQHQP